MTTNLWQQFLNLVHNPSIIKPDDKYEELHRWSLENLVKSYCKTEGIEFKSIGSTSVVISSSSNYYWEFFAYALAYQDIQKIKLFLDYHKENYKGNYYAPRRGFVGHIEHLTYRHMNSKSLQHTQERLNEITEWVREQRQKSFRNTLIKIFISVVAGLIVASIVYFFGFKK